MTNMSHISLKLFLLLFWCLNSFALQAKEERFSVRLIWQGLNLSEHNIATIHDFRTRYPHVSFHHFISPRYDLRENTSDISLKIAFERLWRKGDRLGVYLAAWRELTDRSEILRRRAPSFWTLGNEVCSDDCGLTIPLTVFTKDDLYKLIQTHLTALQDYTTFKGKIDSFMVAGWLNSLVITDSAHQNGLLYNASKISLENSKHIFDGFPLENWLVESWGADSSNLERFFPSIIRRRKLQNLPENTFVLDYHDVSKIHKMLTDSFSNESQSTIRLAVFLETSYMFRKRLEESYQTLAAFLEKD